MTIPKQRRLTRSQFICSSHLIIYYHDIHTTSLVRILLCYVRYIASFFILQLIYHSASFHNCISFRHSQWTWAFLYLCTYYCVPLQYTLFVMPFLCSSATFTSPIEKKIVHFSFFIHLRSKNPNDKSNLQFILHSRISNQAISAFFLCFLSLSISLFHSPSPWYNNTIVIHTSSLIYFLKHFFYHYIFFLYKSANTIPHVVVMPLSQTHTTLYRTFSLPYTFTFLTNSSPRLSSFLHFIELVSDIWSNSQRNIIWCNENLVSWWWWWYGMYVLLGFCMFAWKLLYRLAISYARTKSLLSLY